jgi:ribosomal protein S18 acetylase RimI-like enzyme
MQKEIKIRPANMEDIDGIVLVHIHSFHGFFLSFLGSSFLKVLYSFFLEINTGIMLVAEKTGDGIVGFVAGDVDGVGFYSKAIKRRLFSFAFGCLPALFRNPLILGRLFRALRSGSKGGGDKKNCLLMSIGISPGFSGKGIGSMLEAEFCVRARSLGASNVELTTDSVENESANCFYQRRGYAVNETFSTQEGRVMNRYIKQL